jgi:hypothetical protein
VLSAVALFGVGVYSAVTLVGDWRRSRLKMLVIELGAAGVGFLIGNLSQGGMIVDHWVKETMTEVGWKEGLVESDRFEELKRKAQARGSRTRRLPSWADCTRRNGGSPTKTPSLSAMPTRPRRTRRRWSDGSGMRPPTPRPQENETARRPIHPGRRASPITNRPPL